MTWLLAIAPLLAAEAPEPIERPESAESAESAEAEEEERSFPVAGRLEFSFGSSMLFVEQALLGQDLRRVLPVTSVLFYGEFLIRPRISAALVANVPTGTIRRYDPDTGFIEEHSASMAGVGVAWAPLVHDFSERAYFKPQIAAFAARTIRSTDVNRFFPLATVKFNLCTYEGFTMYIGTAYAFREGTLALIYGFGHRF